MSNPDAKPDTWMPLVIGDYLKDTTRLTTEQHGAYLLLIMSYWVDGPPRDDDEELAAIVGLDAKGWRRNRPKLERFFRIKDGLWTHKRVEEELARWSRKKAAYVERAAAGGRAKAAKSSASSTRKAVLGGCLDPCLEAAPQPTSREVDAHKGQSTLSGRERPEARADGASGLRVIEGGKGEDWASWMDDLSQAHDDYEHFAKTDPEFASEIAEFLDHAETMIRRIEGRAA